MSLEQRHHQDAWLAYLDVINSQVEGEQDLISSSLSPDKVWWLPDKCQYPVNQYARIRG